MPSIEKEMRDISLALGADFGGNPVEVLEQPPRLTSEERIAFLEEQMQYWAASQDSLYSLIKDMRREIQELRHIDQDSRIEDGQDKLNVPIGTVLRGTTKGVPFWCYVKDDGFYVGITRYPSLSAAAEGVSGVRRSGLVFWRIDGGKFDGKSVKDIFKNASVIKA